MNSPVRERLPDRPASNTFTLQCAGLDFVATVSEFSNGRLGEIFLTNHKAGSTAGIMASDAAIAASLALQFGCPVDVLRKALSRSPRQCYRPSRRRPRSDRGRTMMHASLKADTTMLAISAAVAIADAPFAELEHQSRELAAMAACGFLTKQDAVDVAHTAALAAFGPGMVQRHGADFIQEIIAAGFELEESHVATLSAEQTYRTSQATIDAFWYVVRLNDEAELAEWLAEHPDDSSYLKSLLEAKCRRTSN